MRSMRRSTTQDARATADLPDAALVAAAQADASQFSALFDRYWEAVFRYCYFRTGNWHKAEDAASRVFLNALNGIGRFRNDPHELAFRGWLFTIARNVLSNRGRDRDAHSTVPLETAVERASHEPGPEDLALASDTGRRVHELLGALAPNQRELLELRMAGLSTAEIGQVLGMTSGAVRTAQFRAMAVLRDRSAGESGEIAQVSHD